ncbi:hypothetical protein J8O29_001455 [Salmonella enterica]|uniref:Uncharacterized protein n=1 Tax=Salmonella enterica TaxID=28901 RepID=A0A5T3M8W6_SALER|nr:MULTISPECIES: hypothetical protein [Salmonella]EBP4006815.1 hypothetical protein [Salmonella enterica subsp. enterica]EAA2240705.1 hypothetical protein [Salmonella enterica subsp. enterica serovar Singapore]EAA7313863.1 hypothetical protein [Salmonella enterica subsp. enterica serovar Singapore]EAM9371135.1 hypothetical protein [Salmonella enterica]EAN2987419.1 hypothetical protein [Salmonella enterica]
MNHVKKHVLWKDEYFERYYRLNPELVQKRLDKIYQAEDDLMVLISTQLFCFLQANGTLYFDGCYKTGKADNSLLCTNLALWSIGLACDHFDIREERGHTTKCPMTTANCPDFSQWQRPEWFNPLVDFLAQRRPELAFLRHLFI